MTAWVNQVTQVAAASSELAVARFAANFEYETDCWDVHDALQQPDVRKTLLAQGLELAPSTSPDQLGSFVKSEVAKWRTVVQKSGAQLD